MSELGRYDGGWPEDVADALSHDPDFLASDFSGDDRTVSFDESAYGGTAYLEVAPDEVRRHGLEDYSDMGGWA